MRPKLKKRNRQIKDELKKEKEKKKGKYKKKGQKRKREISELWMLQSGLR